MKTSNEKELVINLLDDKINVVIHKIIALNEKENVII
jgi:hypothetical protein